MGTRRLGRAAAAAVAALAQPSGTRGSGRLGAPSGGETQPFPLAISSSGRFLQTAGGAPFLLHGYAGWSILALNSSDRTTFLDNMQAKGVNALIVEAPEYDTGYILNGNGDTPFTGTLGGGQADFTTPRTAYWNYVDSLLTAMDSRGMVAFLFGLYYGFAGTHEGVGVDGWSAANGATRLGTYGAFLGSRYAAQKNIVWVHYGDNLPSSGERTLVKAFQDGIKSTDMAGRLHCNHYARGSLSTDDTTVPADINLAYSAGGSTSPRVHKKVQDGYAVAGPKPVFLGEDKYDHGALTAQQQRCQTWDAWLSGGCGKFFGDEWVWSFDRLNGHHWADHLADQGILEYARVRELLKTRAWQLLVPSTGTGIVTSGGGTIDTDGWKPRALASDGSLGVVYVTDGTSTTINKALFSGSFMARWFDPTDGSFTMISASTANSGTQSYSTPGNNAAGGTDWVWLGEVLV